MSSKNADNEPGQCPDDRIQRATKAPTAQVNLVRRRLLLGGAVAGVGGVAAAVIHDGELGGPEQTFRGAVPWQEGTADVPPGASGIGLLVLHADRTRLHRGRSRAIDSQRSGRTRRRRGRTCRFFSIDNSPAGSGAAITTIWAALGPRARRNRATRAASTPPSSIAPPSRRSTSTSSRISMAPCFSKLAAADQDKVLKGLESGDNQAR